MREVWFASNGESVDPWEGVGRIFEESWGQVRLEISQREEEIVNDTVWREAIDPEEYIHEIPDNTA